MVANAGPSGRAGYGAAYDETSGSVLLFDGEDETTRFGDTWKWDGHGWKRAVTDGPSPRSMAPMVYENNRKRVVLFGGRASADSYLGDTWEWDGTEWHQVSGAGPKPRIGHAMVYSQSLNRVLLFGGQAAMETGIYGDLWEWDGSRWLQRIQPPAPSQIALNKMVPFPPEGGLLLLSGLNAGYPELEMWLWQKNHWELLPGKGPVSTNRILAMSFDSLRKRVVLVGGCFDSPYPAQTWEWDGDRWLSAATGGPVVRGAHSMAFDSARGRMVLLGSWLVADRSKPASLTDTWEWDAKTWVRIDTDVAPKSGGAMAFDPRRKKTVLFSSSRETWEWDGNRWQIMASTGPSSRFGYAMTYSPEREAVILYGGFRGNEGPLNDTWQWDGKNWKKLDIQGPSRSMSSDNPCLAYDKTSKMIILFNQSPRNETWGLR